LPSPSASPAGSRARSASPSSSWPDPSVIFGLWGILTLGPFLAKHVYPIVADHMPDVPVLRYFRQPVGSGEGLLTAGIVLALMIVPIITATTRDLFLQVPPLPRRAPPHSA